jgi:hypothetical protein
MFRRNRIVYAIVAANVIVLGMGSRHYAPELPEFIAEYAGDTLWALLVFLLIGLLMPRWPTWRVALVALLFSFAIELSQLYRAPWIDSVRHTVLGGLVLGFGFLWSDLICYAVGIGTGVAGEYLLRNRSPSL